jgi:hypothetical protein
MEIPGGLSLVPRRAVGSAVRSCRGGNVGRKAREDGFPLTSNDFRECLAGRPDWPEPKSPSRKPFTNHSQGDVPQNYEQRG